MKQIIFLFLVILMWLQYSLWFGKNGIIDLIHFCNLITLYKSENNLDLMKARNDQLLSEIYYLSYSADIIEEYARYDLGMIKPNECFYQLKFDNVYFDNKGY